MGCIERELHAEQENATNLDISCRLGRLSVGVVRVEVIMLKPLALAVAVSASAPLAAYVAYALGEHTRSATDLPYDWQSLNRKSPRYSPLDRKRLDGLVRKVAGRPISEEPAVTNETAGH